MKTSIALLLLLTSSIASYSASFHNLDFDAADTSRLIASDIPGVFYGTPEDLLPGWQLTRTPGQLPLPSLPVVWLNLSPEHGLVSLIDQNYRPDLPESHRFPVAGRFSFAMYPEFAFPSFEPYPFRLKQVGDVPNDAMSISFATFGNPVSLFVNGTEVPTIMIFDPLEGDPNARKAQMLADISSYAGQNVELEFSTAQNQHFGSVTFGIDSIYFSPVPVPEPSVWAIFGLGAVVLGWRWRRRVLSRA